MTLTSKRLPPCPFCGGESILQHHGHRSTGHGESSDLVEIRCQGCKASVADMDYAGYNIEGRKLMVIKAWQSRVSVKPEAPEFHTLAKLKLDDLRTKGYSVSGYAIEKAIPGAEPSRGLITADGFVGWWRSDKQVAVACKSEQKRLATLWGFVPQDASDEELADVIKERDDAEEFGDKLLDLVLGSDRPEWSSAYGTDDALLQVEEKLVVLERAQAATTSTPAIDITGAGAAALDAYLTTCKKNTIVPDVGGAWANAFRAGADYAAQAMARQAGPATWDLIEQLVQLECSKERLHMEYLGKAMPADVYLRFQKLRDERIPALQAQLRSALAAAPTVCDSVHTTDSRKLASTEAPQAKPADALDAEAAIEELHQLGYTFKDGRLVPPDHVGELMAVVQAFACGCQEGTCETKANRACRMTAEIAAMAAAQEAP
jgi:Restriction alleviation protein Lar